MYENTLRGVGDFEGCCDGCAGLGDFEGMGINADTPTSNTIPWWQRAINEIEKIIPKPMSSIPSIPTFPTYPTNTTTPAGPASGMFAPSMDWLTIGALAVGAYLLTSGKRRR